MNLSDWKSHIEQHIAGCKLSWTDRADPWEGATSWALHGDRTFSIMMKHDPPAVVICNKHTVPINPPDCDKGDEPCQMKRAQIAKETDIAQSARAMASPIMAIHLSPNHAKPVEKPANAQTVAVQASFL